LSDANHETQDTTTIQRRECALDLRGFGADGAESERKNVLRALMVSRTGSIVRRRGYDPDAKREVEFDEEVVPEGGDMSIAEAGGVSFLDTHRSYSLRDVIGCVVPGSIRVDADGLSADVELDEEDERARKILRGMAANVSIGYEYTSTERIKRESGIPLVRVTGWRLRELSAVPVGADSGARFVMRGLAALSEPAAELPAEPEPQTEQAQPERQGMTNIANTTPAEPAAAALSGPQTLEAMRYARGLGLGADVAEPLIASAGNMEAALRALLDARNAEQRKQPGPGGTLEPGQDASEKRIEQLGARLAARMHAARSPGIVAPCADAARFASAPLAAIARAHLAACGVHVPEHFGPRRVVELAMKHRSAGPHSTSDFPAALANELHKQLRAIEQVHAPTYQRWAAPKSFVDFRPHPMAAISEDDGLREVAEGDAVTYGTVGDEKETVRAVKYGRKYLLTVETIINDDIGFIAQLTPRFQRRWSAKRNEIVYALLRSNPVMSDGQQFFSAAHANTVVTPTPASPSAEQLEALRRLLSKQTNKLGEKVRYELATYLIPDALRVEFDRLLGRTIQPIVPTDPIGGDAVPLSLGLPYVSDVELDDDPTGYYGFADASERAAEYGQVSEYGDQVFTGWDEERQSYYIHLASSFGFGMNNWRAAAYNAGTSG
jgi:phage head maturation protease